MYTRQTDTPPKQIKQKTEADPRIPPFKQPRSACVLCFFWGVGVGFVTADADGGKVFQTFWEMNVSSIVDGMKIC